MARDVLKVPPMPRHVVESLLKKELAVRDLSEVFSDIDLDTPLGSASIAQVIMNCIRSRTNATGS